MKQFPPSMLETFEARAGEAAAMLKCLANPNRLLVLCQLGDGELQVSELQQRIGLSQSALSQHLARLREDELVSTRREGTAVFYRIENPAVARIIATLAEIYCPPEEQS